MTPNIYLLAFGTFGNPYGFRQTFFKVANENVAKSIKTFDLNTNAIKLFQNTTIYSIRKEIANGFNSVAYSKYTFAKEQNSDRGGTFIGASIYFTNEIAQENLTINKLNEFHKILVHKNIKDETILVNHSDNFSVDLPQDFDKLGFNLKTFDKLNNFNLSNTNLVVFSRINDNTLQQKFKNSLELLNSYDTIFFTDSNEICDFAKSRDIYKVIDENGFDKEIQILREEIKRLIDDFERELTVLDEKKRITIRDFKDSIEQNLRLHDENSNKIEDSKKQINILENKYSEFSKKIKEAINLINSNKNINEVKSFHNKNEREFINFINQKSKPTDLNSLNNIQAKTSLTARDQNTSDSLKSDNDTKEVHQNSKNKKIFFYFIIPTLCVFLLLTSVYLMFFQKPEIENLQATAEVANTNNDNSNSLNPIPNSVINQNDKKVLFQKKIKGKKIGEIVNLIFENNPTEISKIYSFQKKDYQNNLFKVNEKYFKIKNDTICTNDSISKIPSFKNSKN